MIRVTRGDCYWDFGLRGRGDGTATLCVKGQGYLVAPGKAPKPPPDVIREAFRRIIELVFYLGEVSEDPYG